MKHRENAAKVAMVGLGLVLVRFWPLLTGQTLFWGDNYSLYVPGKLFTAGWMSRGIVPLWNPNIMAGIPWLGDINQSVLYPTTLVFMALPAGLALNAVVVFHLWFTFMGMYLLARKWSGGKYAPILASILWSFSLTLTANINNGIALQSAVWLPWVVWASLDLSRLRVGVTLTALTSAGLLWGGYPQYLIYAWLMAIPLSRLWSQTSWRQWIAAWALVGGFTLGLSALWLWPFATTLVNSTRTTQSSDQALSGSLKPTAGIKALVPYVFEKPTLGMKWGPEWNENQVSMVYLTWLGWLALGWVVWRRRLTKKETGLAGLCLVLIIMALGETLPGYGVIYTKIPVISWGRSPVLALIGLSLGLALLTGKALESMKMNLKQFRLWSGVGGVILGWSLAALLMIKLNGPAFWQGVNRLSNNRLVSSQFHTPDRDLIIGRIILENLGVNAGFLIAGLIGLRYRKMLLVTGLVALDMAYNTQGWLHFAEANIYAPQPPQYQEFQQTVEKLHTPQVRFLTRNMNRAYADFAMYTEAYAVRQPFSDSFVTPHELKTHEHLIRLKAGYTPDWNMPANLPLINGYTTLVPKDFALVWANDGEVRINFLDTIEPDSGKLKLWSGAYYIVDKQFTQKLELPHELKVYQDEAFDIYTIPGSLPRLRLADNQPLVYRSLEENPNEIKLELARADEFDLILADRFDPDWIALADGREIAVESYQSMRRVQVPQGTGQLIFSYRPKAYAYGWWVTGVSGIILLVWGSAELLRRKLGYN